jgi:phosphoribosylformylglycinamidine synthase
MESAQAGGKGLDIKSNDKFRKDAWLFGEAQSRVIVSVTTEQSTDFERFLQLNNVSFETLGSVGNNAVIIDGENWGKITDWQRIYDTVLEDIMN